MGLNNLISKKVYHAHKDMETIFGKATNKPAIANLVKRLGLTLEDEDTGEVILTPDEITERMDKGEKELDDLFNSKNNKKEKDGIQKTNDPGKENIYKTSGRLYSKGKRR